MNPYALFFCELAIKTSAVLIGAHLLIGNWRTSSATQRQSAWLIALITILLLPCSLLLEPCWTFSLKTTLSTPQPVIAPQAHPAYTSQPLGQPSNPAPLPAQKSKLGWQTIIILVWLAGCAGILTYRLLGSFYLLRLKHRSMRSEDPRIAQLCTRMRTALKLTRPFDVLITSESKIPMTWGTLHPVLLLPNESKTWNAQELYAVLCHEGAHIARLHHLGRWLAQITCALYWPNPLVWSAIRALRLAQEQSADDHVLCAGSQAASYANQLLQTAIHMKTTPLISSNALGMAKASTLERRLFAIVDTHQSRTSTRWSTRLALLSISTLVLFGSASARLNSEPKQSIHSPNTNSTAVQKASNIILPTLRLKEASLEETIDYLRYKSMELDPEKTGVNLVLFSVAGEGVTKSITLDLKDVSIYQALNSVTKIVGLTLRPSADALLVTPPSWSQFEPLIDDKNSPAYLKAQSLMVPKMNIKDGSADEVVEFLVSKSEQLASDHKRINVVVMPSQKPRPLVRLKLNNVSFLSALNLAAASIGYGIELKDGVFYLVPPQ